MSRARFHRSQYSSIDVAGPGVKSCRTFHQSPTYDSQFLSPWLSNGCQQQRSVLTRRRVHSAPSTGCRRCPRRRLSRSVANPLGSSSAPRSVDLCRRHPLETNTSIQFAQNAAGSLLISSALPSRLRRSRSAPARGERSLKEYRLLHQRDRFGAAAPQEPVRPSIERSSPVEGPRRDQLSDAAPARSGRSPLTCGPSSRRRSPG